jgi:carboxymethylenebutenolidase
MPIYDPQRVEFTIVSGHVGVNLGNGRQIPAYWSHPDMGGTFPSVALLHDWWGIRPLERRLAQTLAQLGYYVIVPDLFDGKVADTPQDAMKLVEMLDDHGYEGVDAALQVMEKHLRSNRHVAAVGLGMGGSLAYEAAIKRTDLEAAVAFYGFPQRHLGHFKEAKAPILAIYGSEEPYTKPSVIEKMREELSEVDAMGHQVMIMDGVGRDFFATPQKAGTHAWMTMLSFLEKHLAAPAVSTGRIKR